MAVKLGQILIEAKLITPEQLDEALQAQARYGGKLGTNLIELGFVTDHDLVELLSKQLHMNAANAGEFENISTEALRIIPKDYAIEHKVIPLKLETRLRVAVSDPSALLDLDSLSFKIGKTIQPVIAPEIWIIAALERHYGYRRETRYVLIDPEVSLEIVENKNSLDNLPQEVIELKDQLKPEITFREYVELLLKAEGSNDVFSAMFEVMSTYFPQLALYAVRDKSVRGFMLHGFAVHNKVFAETMMEADKTYFMKAILEKKQVYLGKIPAGSPDTALFSQLDLAPDKELAIFPIVFKNEVVSILLCCSPNMVKVSTQAKDAFNAIVTKAGQALEYVQLKKRISAL